MGRTGKIDIDKIIDEAVNASNRRGLENLSMNDLADALGVRTPSLYSHVAGIDEIRRLLAIRALKELDHYMSRAALGKSAEDAIYAICKAYRDYAIKNPGIYAALVPTPSRSDREWTAAKEQIMETMLAAIHGYGFDEDEEVHVFRALRSMVHGFVWHEMHGAFKKELDHEESFKWLVSAFVLGLQEKRKAKLAVAQGALAK